jgi:Zn-dependent protease
MLENNTVILVILSLAVLAVSITIHEFMHGLASHLLGDDTAKLSGRLTLNPLKHIDLFTTILLPVVLVIAGLPPFGAAKPVPFNPYKLKFAEFGAAIVGAAGPLSNLVLASAGGLILRLTGTLNSSIWVTWWWLFIVINIGFFIFNLIPLPPLDGSRILYAFAPEFLQDIMIKLERLGFMVIVVFMLVLFPLISPLLQRADNWLVNLLVGI